MARSSTGLALTVGIATAVLTVLTALTVAVTARPAGAAPASSPGGRITQSEVIARAQSWQTQVPPCGYTPENSATCNTPDPEGVGYRSDCSGFVSMALHLRAPGLDTQQLASSFTPITKDALQVGDILDNPPAGQSGHVVLFAGWTSTAHTAYRGYEFGQGAKPTYHVIPYPYFANPDGTVAPYQPFHYSKLISDGTRNGPRASTPASTPATLSTATEIAFGANTAMLATSKSTTDKSTTSKSTTDKSTTGFGLMPGTSPSIAAVAGGYQVAFQANTGMLWTVGALGTRDWKLALMAGTSPSIAAVAGGFQVAFQSSTGELWTVGALGNRGWGQSLNRASSPSIAAFAGSFQVAFEAITDELWTIGPAGGADSGLGMIDGSSPSIAAVTGGYETAYAANTGELATTGAIGTRTTGLAMLAGTSPSITGVTGGTAGTAGTGGYGGYEVAFTADTGLLWTTGTIDTRNTGLAPIVGTSPAIAAVGGSYQVAFQSADGNLSTLAGDTGRPMLAATSPAIT